GLARRAVAEGKGASAPGPGRAAIKKIVAAIDSLAKDAGKPKRQVAVKDVDPELVRDVEQKALAPLTEAMRLRDKLTNYARVDQVQEELLATFDEVDAVRKAEAKSIFKGLKEKVLRDEVLDRRVRLDGRKFDEIRSIWTEAGRLPRHARYVRASR